LTLKYDINRKIDFLNKIIGGPDEMMDVITEKNPIPSILNYDPKAKILSAVCERESERASSKLYYCCVLQLTPVGQKPYSIVADSLDVTLDCPVQVFI
jgi:hypothetical protein